MKTVPLKQWLAFAALAVVWGSTWIASDTLTEYVPPLHGSAFRFLLAAVLCIPLILLKRLPLPRGRALAITLLLSATMIALPFMLLLWAKQRVSSATMTVLFAAMPLLVVLLTPLAVPRRALQAAIVGLGAMALVVGATPSWTQAGGAVVALAAVASIGGSSLVARRELGGVHPVVVTALLTAMAALILFPAGLIFEHDQPAQWNHDVFASLLFLGGVAGAPAYAAYFWLLQQREAYQLATLEWMEPLIAISESAFFLRQGLSFSMIAGSLVTLVCVLLILKATAEDDDSVSLLGN